MTTRNLVPNDSSASRQLKSNAHIFASRYPIHGKETSQQEYIRNGPVIFIRPLVIPRRNVSDPRSNQAHVDPPEQPDEVEEHDPALDRHAAETNNGREGPDLVSGDDDGDRLGAHVARDHGRGLPLQHAHEDEEGDRVEDGAHRDAVDEPLGQRVPDVQPGLRLRLGPGARAGLGGRCRALLLEVARAVGRRLALVSRKRPLE